MRLEQVQYVCNLYLNTCNSGCQHYQNFSWRAPEPLQEKITSLEEAMAKLAKSQVELTTSHTQFMNEISQPPQEKKSNLEEAMAHMASPHAQFMNEARQPPQEKKLNP